MTLVAAGIAAATTVLLPPWPTASAGVVSARGSAGNNHL